MFLIGPQETNECFTTSLTDTWFALALTSINKFDIEIKHNEPDIENRISN